MKDLYRPPELAAAAAANPTKAATSEEEDWWVCGHCTYAGNPQSFLCCDACGARRDATDQASDCSSETRLWVCQFCEFDQNAFDVDCCQSCDREPTKEAPMLLAPPQHVGPVAESKTNWDDASLVLKKLSMGAMDIPRQTQLAVVLMKNAEDNPNIRKRMIYEDSFQYLIPAFHETDDCHRELRTAIGMTVAYILRSGYPQKIRDLTKEKRKGIVLVLGYLQQTRQYVTIGGQEMTPQRIERVAAQAYSYFSLLDIRESHKQGRTLRLADFGIELEPLMNCLGSDDVNILFDAVLSLMDVAKFNPAQGALMLNYGVATRLIDIVQSDGSQQLKVAAALSLAYIDPSQDGASPSRKEASIKVLEACRNQVVILDGAAVTSQELDWACDCLRRCLLHNGHGAFDLGPNHAITTSLTETSMMDEQKPMTTSQLDLQALHSERKIDDLLDVLSGRTCRMLDAALLLLFSLLREDDEVGSNILSRGGLKCLLDIFFDWEKTSGELRVALWLIVTCLEPLVVEPPSELKTNLWICIQFAPCRKAVEGIRARAIYKIHPTKPFRFEPTSYNCTQEDGYIGIIKLNSLGLVGLGTFWTWDCIIDCKLDGEVSVKLTTSDPHHKEVTFDVQHHDMALLLLDDVLGRQRLWGSQGLHSDVPGASSASIGAETLHAPPYLNISNADNPGCLGVSVHHLQNYFLPKFTESYGFSTSSNFYDTVDFVKIEGQSTVCPMDGRMGAAYVNCLEGPDHVGTANHMFSWTWGYEVKDVVDTLVHYCESRKYDPRRVYVWICWFCMNQHRVAETQAASVLDFEKVFKNRTLGIGRVLVMMQPWNAPLNLGRVWCVFECFLAYTSSCEVSIVMPPREVDRMGIELVSSVGKDSKPGLDSLYAALNSVDLEKAESSVDDDKEKILGMIQKRIGFVEVNMLVRDSLRFWVRKVIDSLVEERERFEVASESNLLDSDSDLDTDLDLPSNTAAKLSFCKFQKQVGDLYNSYGDYSAAYGIYSKCLSLRLSLQGEHHKDVSGAYTDLGKSLFAQGMLEESLDMYLKALSINQRKDKGHLDTAYFHVGKLLQEMGNRDEAMDMMQKCLIIQEDKFKCREAVVTRSHIALLLGEGTDKGSKQQALEMVQSSLTSLLEFDAGEHPDTAFCYRVMSTILEDANVGEAISMLDQCQAIQESVLGSCHPLLVNTHTHHGDILRRQNRLEEALFHYRCALRVYQASAGSNRVPIARLYASMSVAETLLGHFEEARRFHGKAMEVLEASKAVMDKAVMDQRLVLVYSGTGEQKFDSGHFELALLLFRRAMDVMIAMLGEDHADLAAGYKIIASTLFSLGDSKGAKRENKKAQAVHKAREEEESNLLFPPPRLVAQPTTDMLQEIRGRPCVHRSTTS